MLLRNVKIVGFYTGAIPTPVPVPVPQTYTPTGMFTIKPAQSLCVCCAYPYVRSVPESRVQTQENATRGRARRWVAVEVGQKIVRLVDAVDRETSKKCSTRAVKNHRIKQGSGRSNRGVHRPGAAGVGRREKRFSLCFLRTRCAGDVVAEGAFVVAMRRRDLARPASYRFAL